MAKVVETYRGLIKENKVELKSPTQFAPLLKMFLSYVQQFTLNAVY